jgi:hypothetical protein
VAWRLVQLTQEARSNQAGSRALAPAILATTLLAVVGLWLASSALDSLGQEVRLRDAGGLVWVARPAEDKFISAKDCEDLRRASQVLAAGGLSALQFGDLALRPGGLAVPVVRATPGAYDVWGLGPARAVVGQDLQSSSGLYEGAILVDRVGRGHEVSIAGVLPERVPVASLRSSVTVPTSGSVGNVSECWALFEPGAGDSARDLIFYQLSDSDPEVFRYADRGAAEDQPAARWDRIISQQPALVGGVLLAAMLGLFAWNRRIEVAIYLVTGTRRAEVLLLRLFEAAYILVPAGSIAILSVAAFLRAVAPWPIDASSVFVLCGRQVIGAACIGMIGYVYAPIGMRTHNVVALLKDR